MRRLTNSGNCSRFFLLARVCSVLLLFTLSAQAQFTISTIAGNGVPGFNGDNIPAISAQINVLGFSGITSDAQGNLYIADTQNHRVRKIDSNGVITTIAGTGSFGFSGDGGSAAVAQLNAPTDVAVDSQGNIYIADSGNNRIRKITLSTGEIQTVAGIGSFGSSGDGGPPLQAAISPRAIAVADDEVFFIAELSDRIRVVANDVIDTYAGNGNAGFSGDGGQAVNAELNGPKDLALDNSGSLYFADEFNHAVRKIDPAGVITTLAGNGSAGFAGDGGAGVNALLNRPNGVAVFGNIVYIADAVNNRIRRIDGVGILTTIAGSGGLQGFSGDGGPATQAQLWFPTGLTVDDVGNPVFCDCNNVRIRKLTGDNTPNGPVYTSEPPPGQLLSRSGRTELEEADPGVFNTQITESLPSKPVLSIRNNGDADLILELSKGIADLFVVTAQGQTIDDQPTTFVLAPGAAVPPLVLAMGCSVFGDVGNPPINISVNGFPLVVTSNDPNFPEVVYQLTCIATPYIMSEQEESVIAEFFAALIKSAGDTIKCNERVTFVLDELDDHNVNAGIPDFLGGGSVQIDTFSGQVDVALRPVPNDTEHCSLSITGGQFTAPTVTLPSGLSTGLNTFTFNINEPSLGMLNLTTGEYTVSATGTIANNLFPHGIETEGEYSGIYDFATRTANAQSQTTDYIRSFDQSPVIFVEGYEERERFRRNFTKISAK